MDVIQLSIDILLKLIIVLILLLSMFVIYLIWKRRSEMLTKSEKEIYIQKTELLWYQFLRGECELSRELIPRNLSEFAGVEEILLCYLRNFDDERIRERISSFANDYMLNHYLDLLTSRRWSMRMNALYRIHDFRLHGLNTVLRNLQVPKLSKEEYFQFMKILAYVEPKHFMTQLNLVSLSEFEYKKLCLQVNQQTLEEMLKDLDQYPVSLRYALIAVMGIKGGSEELTILENLLDKTEDTEIRIRTLKEIYHIGIIANWQRYIPFLNSDIWQERLMAAKILRHVPFSEAKTYIAALGTDASWWVRLQTAGRVTGDHFTEDTRERFVSELKRGGNESEYIL